MNPNITRRDFSRRAGIALVGAIIAPRVAAEAAGGKLFSAMGIAGTLEKAAFYKERGAEFLTESVSGFLVPDQPDSVFARNLEKLAASPLPVLACNGFIRPKHLICVGKDANHDSVLDWAGISFRRLKQAGGTLIVFGSSSSRKIPEGWSKEQADEQFVALLKKMGPLAEQAGVTVVVEQLKAEECNYINHIAEGAALIRAAGHPHVRMLADLHHMVRMGDGPEDLKEAMDVVKHVEIAEDKNRTYPGVEGDDFRPFFRVLKQAGYHGAINIEGRGKDEELAPAFKEILKQASEV